MSAQRLSFSAARRAASTVCAVALSLFAAGAALASDEAASTKLVRYEDLDLRQSRDSAVLYSRLKNAAQAACAYYDGSELHLKRTKRECVHAALSDAVAEIDHAALTALHAAEERVRLAQGRASDSPRT